MNRMLQQAWTNRWAMALYFAVALWTAAGGASDDARNAVVAVERLNLRPVPGLHEPPVKTLSRGDRLHVIGCIDGWLEVRHDTDTGFVRNLPRFVQISPQNDGGSDLPDDPDQRLEYYKTEAASIDRRIARCEDQVQAFTDQERSVLQALAEIEKTLARSIQKAAAMRRESERLDAAAARTQGALADIKAQIEVNQDYMARRLSALYKLNCLGHLHVLASADSIQGLFRRHATLKKILEHDESVRLQLVADRTRMLDLIAQLEDQQTEQNRLARLLQEQIEQIEKDRRQRQALLSNVRREKALKLAAVEELKAAAVDLNEKIDLLQVKVVVPRPDDGAKPFALLKGLLKMPVAGKIVARFGEKKDDKYNVVNFRSGITIEADRGEPIHAVAHGNVLFADWFKGYGNMIIIDHGQSYYTVYAHAEELFKTQNSSVAMGEVIGTVGDSASLIGPGLYFEVRHHGKPLNPLQWFERS